MLEMAMTAAGAVEGPAILLDELDGFADFHASAYKRLFSASTLL